MTSAGNEGANLGQISRQQFEGNALPVDRVVAAASIFTWKKLQELFLDIQTKAPQGGKVAAMFTRTESPTGSITEEWMVRGDPACRVEFEQLASIASRKLGCADDDTTKYWLDHVRKWMTIKGLDKSGALAWVSSGYSDFEGVRAKTQDLDTERLADLSAMFCLGLMADGTPESVKVPSSADNVAAPATTVETQELSRREKGKLETKKNYNAARAEYCIQSDIARNRGEDVDRDEIAKRIKNAINSPMSIARIVRIMKEKQE